MGLIPSYRVKRLYHPTHWVPDLDEVASFFQAVFGRPSMGIPEFMGLPDSRRVEGYRTDYCLFTPVADVLFDSVDPARHIVDGCQVHPDVTTARLGGMGWFVDGIEELWPQLRRAGIRGTDQSRRQPDGEEIPVDVSGTPIVFTMGEDTGIDYEFLPYLPHRDPRGDPPRSAVGPDDPLGIERCAHHTVVTADPDRCLGLLVGILGGKVVSEARNDVRGGSATYVALGEQVVEILYGLHDGSPAALDWEQRAPLDSYHALTWQVRDLGRVREHLGERRVRLQADTASLVVVDPVDGLGIPWGFCATSTS